MKKPNAKRLSLSPHTVRVLGQATLATVAAGQLAVSQNKDEGGQMICVQTGPFCNLVGFHPI